jgi:HEAT repeat protein
MGAEAKEAVPALIAALKDQDGVVRSSAADALGRMGGEAVPALIAALKDQDGVVRRFAADALGRMGAAAKEAAPALIAALKDQDGVVRNSAADALGQIATALLDTRSTESLDQLKTAYEALNANPDLKAQAILVKRTIEYFESLWWVQARESTVKIISDHFYISITVATYLLLQFIWLLCFWLRPPLLLKILTSLSQIGEKLRIPVVNISMPLKTVLVFPLFHYRPRLLDAWVKNHLAIAGDNFARKQTVAQRKIYVAMPAQIDGKMCEGPSAALLQPIFDKKKVTLLIAGEGGAGKTSLACQMAAWAMADDPERRLCKTHRMLPVLIEADLTPIDDKNALFEAIRGGLRELIGEPEPIFGELLMQLLRKRRVLVIVDSLSEQDETTRKNVRPAHADFPVAALVVTSRINEDLGGAAKTLLNTIRLKSDRLSTFMDRYLEQIGKRELFEDKEYFDACSRLSDFVSDRDITVLIAKMYAEQMVAAKEADAGARASAHDMPRNLPDLMLSYVNNLNEQVKAERQDIEKVIRVAKVAAWECLKHTCRPTTVKRADVLKALSNEVDAETLLKYLIGRLQLIQTAGPISDLVRFSLDPLAEYLAAFYLVERCGKFEDLWKEFFDTTEKEPGAPETIKGFLLAVRDCCLEKGIGYNVPEWVGDKLAQLAGLDEEAIKTVQLRQRIKLLLANLSSPDEEDRIRAVEILGEIGPEAKEVVPALIAALNDQDYEVRRSAAEALERMGAAAKEAVPALIEALNDEDDGVSRSAADALGWMGGEALPALIAALKDQNSFVHRSAAEALALMGAAAKEAVPALIAALKDQNSFVRLSAAAALWRMGAEAKEAVPALIAALKDQDGNVRRYAAEALNQIDPSTFQSN